MENHINWVRPRPLKSSVTDSHFSLQNEAQRIDPLMKHYARVDWRPLLLFTLIGLAGISCFIYSMMFRAQGVAHNSKDLPANRFQFDKCFKVESPNKRDNLFVPQPRVILIVIDAWRFSFLADDDSPMKFLRKSIEFGRAVLFKAEVQSPTVTMPRIKAMTCGIVPTFASALWNFGNVGNVTEDSWIKQAHAGRKKLLFYGDNTWLQMYPENFFAHSHGVPSFFVKDYTSVDEVVTTNYRHVLETTNKNFDMMVLHYLGLDHIGHSLNAEPKMIQKKLIEMDEVIKDIFMTFRNDGPLVLIVAGDHGMTDFGAHGGSSYDETRVPIVVIHSKASVLKGHNFSTDPVMEIQQVDVAPTISAFLRVNKPADSIGVTMIPHLRRHWRLEKRTLFSELYEQVIQFRHATEGSKVYESLIVKAVAANEEETCQYAHELIAYKLDGLLTFFRGIQGGLLEARNHGIGLLGLLSIVTITIPVILLYDMETEALRKDLNSLKFHRQIQLSLESFLHNLLGFLIVILPVCFSFASSLVEEEHDVWYFLASLMLIMQTFSLARHALYKDSSHNCPPEIDWKQRWDRLVDIFTSGLVVLVLHRMGMGFFSLKRRRWQTQLVFFDLPGLPLYLSDGHLFSLINSLAAFFDIKKLCSDFPVTMGLCSSGYLAHRLCEYAFGVKKYRSFNYTVVAFYLMSSFRLVVGDVYGDSDSFFTVFSGGSALLLLCFFACFSSPCIALIIYLTFLVSPEHHVLISIVLEMGLRTKSLFIERTYLFVMIQSVFFYMGTSNSLQNIDVRAGYMGLTEYNATLVGIQMLLNTYALQIVFLIGYSLYGFPSEDPVDSINTRQRRNNGTLDNFLLSLFHFKLTITAASCWAFYCFSNHLFVWSVYAPKTFFECIHGVIAAVVAILVTLCLSLWG